MKEKVPAEGFDLDPLNTGRRRLCSMLDAPGLVKVVHVAAFSALGHSVRRLRSIAPIEMAVSAAAYIPQEKKKEQISIAFKGFWTTGTAPGMRALDWQWSRNGNTNCVMGSRLWRLGVETPAKKVEQEREARRV